MTPLQLYDLWAPPDLPWSAWAKPVLFAQIESHLNNDAAPDHEWTTIDLPRLDPGAAIVVDLPGADAVHVARSAAQQGFRPVPLYNAVSGPTSTDDVVRVGSIVRSLIASAPWLAELNLPADAPPVFLLDAARNPPMPIRQPGMFDNRSISLPTDFPSAAMLKSHGVRGITLISAAHEPPAADLAHTLRRWQDAGLPITQLAKATGIARAITVGKPMWYRTLWHNMLATLGLKKSPLGGFGGLLPMPTSSAS